MAKKHPSMTFYDLFLNVCKANKNCDYSANFQKNLAKFFYIGPHIVKFTFAFDTTLIRLEMTKIWPKVQSFLPSLYQESSDQRSPRDGVNVFYWRPERSHRFLRKSDCAKFEISCLFVCLSVVCGSWSCFCS